MEIIESLNKITELDIMEKGYTTKRKTKWMLENVCRARVIGFRALNALVGGVVR